MAKNVLLPLIQPFGQSAVKAHYTPTPVRLYRGNPLIEALPPILSREQAYQALERSPEYAEEERLLDTETRLHCLETTAQFYQPLSRALTLEGKFSRMLRSGYLPRNPLVKRYWPNIEAKIKHLEEGLRAGQKYQANANGNPVVGISGIGKSTTVNAILSLYPQVIYHSEYDGRPFPFTQLTYLKTECPGDGSIKGLAFNFLLGVDAILNTNYFHNYGSSRASADFLLVAVSRVAALHGLGCWVIDEIQNLSEAKSGGVEKVLNYFVYLENELQLPIMPIGTPKAIAVLSTNEFRQARRLTGGESSLWERMKNDEEWEVFIRALWLYQYTRKACPLKPELSNTLYDISQGITDIAIKVYRLAQIRAITSGKEVVTPSVLRSVAKDNLQLVNDCLQAIRNGDQRALEKFSDIYSTIDLAKAGWPKLPAETLPQPRDQTTPLEATSAPAPPSVGNKATTPKKSKKKSKENPTKLVATAAKGESQQQEPHIALKQAGYIQPLTDFLQE